MIYFITTNNEFLRQKKKTNNEFAQRKTLQKNQQQSEIS